MSVRIIACDIITSNTSQPSSPSRHGMDRVARRRRLAPALSVVALLLSACREDAVGPALTPLLSTTSSPSIQAYSYTIIADSKRDKFDPFEFGCPALNDAGAIAFRGRKISGATGIYRGSGTAPTVIVQDSFDKYAFIGRHPSINNLGDVSFAARLRAGGEAIMRGRGGVLTTIATTQPGVFNFFAFDTSINDFGVVAFTGELDNFDEGLFFGSGAGTTTVFLASSSPFQGRSVGPAINNNGQIAFHEDLDAGGSGAFRWDGTSFITIATSAGTIGGFPRTPSLNDNGVVAFDAFFDTGAAAILKGSGGSLTTIASSAGPFSSFNFNGPSINNRGRVAFSATLDAGGDGIFVSPNPIAKRVIGTDDALAGSTVTGVILCREGLNTSGQVAFQAQLNDGRSVIARATPSTF